MSAASLEIEVSALIVWKGLQLAPEQDIARQGQASRYRPFSLPQISRKLKPFLFMSGETATENVSGKYMCGVLCGLASSVEKRMQSCGSRTAEPVLRVLDVKVG